MAIVVSLTSLIVGIIFSPVIVSIVMIFLEIIFSIWLSFEIKVLGKRIYITENEGMHRGG